MARLESGIEKMLIKACKLVGIKTIKLNAGKNKGIPDRVIFNHLKNNIHYIELKNETYYKQQKTQKQWQKIIEASGGTYFLLDGEKEVKDYIDKELF